MMLNTLADRLTKRLVLVVLTATFVTVGVGFGVVAPALLSGPTQPAALGPATLPDDPGDLTAPPRVTPQSGTAGTTTESGTAPSVQPTIRANVSGVPGALGGYAGHVSALAVRLSGTIEMDPPPASATRAMVVVQTWTPGSGWSTVDRANATVAPGTSSIDVATVRNGTALAYATGERAGEFDNPEDGTAVARQGSVAVTVVLFENGTRVAVDRYRTSFGFRVRNLEADGDGGGGGTPTRPDLVLERRASDPTHFAARNVAPGQRANWTLRARNAGDARGRLVIAVANRSSAENGLTEPERRVDRDAESELPAHLLVRIAVHRGGDVTYLAGASDRMVRFEGLETGSLGSVPLAVDENASIQVEWHVSRAAGNEIQSDAVSLDVVVSLQDTGSSPALPSALEWTRNEGEVAGMGARHGLENPSTIIHLRDNTTGG